MELDSWKAGDLVSCLVNSPISQVLCTFGLKRIAHREMKVFQPCDPTLPPPPFITRAGAGLFIKHGRECSGWTYTEGQGVCPQDLMSLCTQKSGFETQ